MEKVTLITGAGGGLGKEFAYIYAKNGNNLVLVDVDEAGLKETEAYVKEKSPDTASADGHCEGENMTEQEMQEHACKELLKKIVDNGQNYTEKMKSDLKEIIDLGKSPEEICEATLAYFAMCRWQ